MGSGAYARGSINGNAKDQARIEKQIKDETVRQIRLTKTLKAEKAADRKLRIDLRRGKTKKGVKHTLKDKDNLVRKINQNTGAIKKLEGAIKRSKEVIKEYRGRKKTARQEERNLKNTISKSDSRCKAIDKEMEKIKFD